MSKWLNLIEDDALESFAWDKFLEFTGFSNIYDAKQAFDVDPDFEKINISGMGNVIKVEWTFAIPKIYNSYDYEEHFYYYNDFFSLKYDEKHKVVSLRWKDDWYNSKEALEKVCFDEKNDIIMWVNLIVSSIKEKGLDYKQYIREFKKAYIKEFELENINNNRTKLIKKLFRAIDERYLEQEDSLTL